MANAINNLSCLNSLVLLDFLVNIMGIYVFVHLCDTTYMSILTKMLILFGNISQIIATFKNISYFLFFIFKIFFNASYSSSFVFKHCFVSGHALISLLFLLLNYFEQFSKFISWVIDGYIFYTLKRFYFNSFGLTRLAAISPQRTCFNVLNSNFWILTVTVF